MTSRDYTIVSIIYVGIVFGFACLMQWAPFMRPFVVWCWHHDTATLFIIIGILMPMMFLLIGGAKEWQREQSGRN